MFKLFRKKEVEIEEEMKQPEDIFDKLTSESISKKVEKKKDLEGELETLKKKQKLELETIAKEFGKKREDLTNNIQAEIKGVEAEISNLQNKINSLHSKQDSDLKLIAEELKVAIEIKTNEYNAMIVNTANQIKRLNRIINAEAESINDLINPSLPNAPMGLEVRKPLLESTPTIETIEETVMTEEVVTKGRKKSGKAE